VAPLIIAHRGFALRSPENSLEAFRAAVEIGLDGIELDVHDTADGVLVVHHDPEVGGRPIRAQQGAAVRRQRLANGEPIPTLEEALEAIGDRCLVFVEVKSLDPRHDARLLAALKGGPAPARYHVHSFDHRVVRRLLAQRSGLVGGILSSSYPVDPWRQMQDAGAVELWQEAPLIDQELVRGAHQRGFRVYAWTVDQPERARELVATGVDGLCTNRPEVVRGV
jgi:glycerophosphoryl diester phosphodiesterase